jgi:hypothetical protein
MMMMKMRRDGKIEVEGIEIARTYDLPLFDREVPRYLVGITLLKNSTKAKDLFRGS